MLIVFPLLIAGCVTERTGNDESDGLPGPVSSEGEQVGNSSSSSSSSNEESQNTQQTEENREEGDYVTLNEEEYRVVNNLGGGEKSLVPTDRERERMVEFYHEMLLQFGSEDPENWQEAAEEIKQFEPMEFVRSEIVTLAQTGTNQTPEGERARNELVRIGRILSELHRLPSKDQEVWDEVRENVLAIEGPTKDLLVERLLIFLSRPREFQHLAANQMIKLGDDVIEDAWEYLNQTGQNVYEADQQAGEGQVQARFQNVFRGIILVLLQAQRYELLREAANHKSSRVRLALAYTLSRAESHPTVYDILGDLARNDPSFEVRGEAVSTLGTLEGHEAIDHLEAALKDEHDGVELAAIRQLREFRAYSDIVSDILLDHWVHLRRTDEITEQKRTAIVESLKWVTREDYANNLRAWMNWNESQ